MIYTVAGSFAATIFSFQLIFEAAKMHEQAYWTNKMKSIDEKYMEYQEEKKEEPKKEDDTKKDDHEPRTADVTPVLKSCCCCVCVCSNDHTEDLTCFGCFPIKCGIMAIGIFTFLLTIGLCTYNFFFILNEYVAWYFPVVVLVLLIPLVVATFFWVTWFTKDGISQRGRLGVACQLAIISIALCCIWTLVYFIWLYKKESVYTGYGDPEILSMGYRKTPKKVYVFFILAESLILIALYSYFLCICERYYDHMLHKPEQEEDMEKDE